METDSRIGGGASAHVYRHPLLSFISTFLGCLTNVSDPSAKRRVRWTPQAASTAAVLMAWDRGCSLQSRFDDARSCLRHDFRGRHRVGATYNGLLKALERQQATTLPIVKTELRRQIKRHDRSIDPTSPWMLLAVDGSKEDLPRTRDQEAVFGIADNGAFPQALVTAIVEVHTGLLWDWRIDRGRGSEKHHLIEMIDELPSHALLLADGNFVGFPIWSKLHQQNKLFVIRVGGNIRLLKRLWPQANTRREKDIVYVWSKKFRTQAPLQLRLIQIGSRSRPVYLLTNVLDSKRLSRKAAGAIYRHRWGVELFYRTFKRTLGFAKLQSRAGRRARIELEWGLVALGVATLLGVEALIARHRSPRRLSPAALARTLRTALLRGAGTTARTLNRLLQNSIKDQYQRHSSKQSRHRIVTRNTPQPLALKPPLVRDATQKEQQEALKFLNKTAA
jgi:hypothetical protein